MARELTRLAEEVGDVPLIAYGRQLVIGYLLEKCDIEGFLRELDALEQFAKIRSDHSARWLLAAIHATHAHLEGQLASAESFATQALHVWADRPQFTPPAQLFAGQMIMLRREQGRLDELVELVGAYVRKTPEFPSWRCALAHIYAHLGNGDRARHELELLGDLSSLPRDGFWLLNLTWVGIAASLLDDHDRSRETYKLLLPYADTCLVAVSLLCEGSTARPLGMLATTLGRYDDAELHLERALEMNTRIRSPLWTAHTQYEYAHMLRLRDRPGDNDRARILLRTASATADALGLHALSRRASAVAGLTEGADSSLRRP
jgi:tetratricopeptide (TPR) repeat protein